MTHSPCPTRLATLPAAVQWNWCVGRGSQGSDDFVPSRLTFSLSDSDGVLWDECHRVPFALLIAELCQGWWPNNPLHAGTTEALLRVAFGLSCFRSDTETVEQQLRILLGYTAAADPDPGTDSGPQVSFLDPPVPPVPRDARDLQPLIRIRACGPRALFLDIGPRVVRFLGVSQGGITRLSWLLTALSHSPKNGHRR